VEHENIDLPIIDPSIQTHLDDKALELLWDPNEGLRAPNAVYVPKVLALFGWKLINVENIDNTQNKREKPSFLCQFCGRKLPLASLVCRQGNMQNFQENHQIANTSGNNDKTLFHPIEEHKYFCKWSPDEALNKQGGWSIVLEMLKYQSFSSRNLFDKSAIEGINNVEENHENKDSVAQDQTKFKLEILGTIQELKSLKEKTLKRCEDILKLTQNMDIMGVEEVAPVTEVNVREKPDLVESVKELGINADPIKKVKA